MKNTIKFHSGTPATEVLRLSKDGIWANPEIPVDDAAKLVLEAIDDNIKILVQKAVLAEREACAKKAETLGVHPALNVFAGGPDWYKHGKEIAAVIRARGNT
jgi:hypothetical protein